MGKTKIASRVELDLPNGGRLLLRPINPNDRERLLHGFALLSAESRYLRFFSPIDRLTEKQLRDFTEVDQFNHAAWLALDANDLEYPILGVGRFVRVAETPEIAEMAFAVVDAHQRRGIGSILLALMYLVARYLGVSTLRGILLPENRVLSGWLEDLGATIKFDGGSFRVDLPVHGNLGDFPDTEKANEFVQMLMNLEVLLYS